MTEMMLKPGEVRTAELPDGYTVKIYAVANGAFTHVRVSRPGEPAVFATSKQFETDALALFARIKAQKGV